MKLSLIYANESPKLRIRLDNLSISRVLMQFRLQELNKYWQRILMRETVPNSREPLGLAPKIWVIEGSTDVERNVVGPQGERVGTTSGGKASFA